jgi:hypothetical protein
MALPDGVGWFGTPDALVDDYFDVLSPSACKFLWLLLRHTAGYQSYQDNPAPLRLSTREIREGRRSKAGAKLGKGSKLSKHTIIEAIRECEDLGLLYTEEDRNDLARIEKRYALLNPGCLGLYCTLDGSIQVDLWCGSYQPRQPARKICTSHPSVNDDQVCYGCLAEVQKLHSEVQELHSTGQKLHTRGAGNAQRSHRDSLHKEFEIENRHRAGADAPALCLSQNQKEKTKTNPQAQTLPLLRAIHLFKKRRKKKEKKRQKRYLKYLLKTSTRSSSARLPSAPSRSSWPSKSSFQHCCRVSVAGGLRRAVCALSHGTLHASKTRPPSRHQPPALPNRRLPARLTPPQRGDHQRCTFRNGATIHLNRRRTHAGNV